MFPGANDMKGKRAHFLATLKSFTISEGKVMKDSASSIRSQGFISSLREGFLNIMGKKGVDLQRTSTEGNQGDFPQYQAKEEGKVSGHSVNRGAIFIT